MSLRISTINQVNPLVLIKCGQEMPTRTIVTLGVLSLLNAVSSYFVPKLYSSGWRKTNNHVGPTNALSRVHDMLNDANNVGTYKIIKPLSAFRMAHDENVKQLDDATCPTNHIDLDLKIFLEKKGITEVKYRSMSDELQYKCVELHENSKRGKTSIILSHSCF